MEPVVRGAAHGLRIQYGASFQSVQGTKFSLVSLCCYAYDCNHNCKSQLSTAATKRIYLSIPVTTRAVAEAYRMPNTNDTLLEIEAALFAGCSNMSRPSAADISVAKAMCRLADFMFATLSHHSSPDSYFYMAIIRTW